MILVLAEKPSVARDIARMLGVSGRGKGFLEGEGIKVSWCHGHMAELVEPAHYDAAWKVWALNRLPMLPEQFALQVRSGAKEQFAVLRKLLRAKGITEVVNACDAGREGELIFRYVYELAGCRAPVTRLWVASLTERALRQAWGQRRPGGELDRLADAARSRSEADWLVGLNATRALTCLARQAGGGNLMSLGRVQTPTLAMIVRRDREIAAFEPQPFWTVKAALTADSSDVAGPGVAAPVSWQGVFFQPGGAGGPGEKKAALEERLSSEAAARAICAALEGQGGTVTTSDRRPKVERPPLLHDLTSLQRRANQRYGFSAKHTLEVAQALYERHKLITYPRTDARKLTPDEVPLLPGILDALSAVPVYAPHCASLRQGGMPKPGKRVVDASEVGDHHAILPTDRPASSRSLSADEKRIYDLIARRLLAVLSPDARFETTTLVVEVVPKPDVELPEPVQAPLRLRARGRVCLDPGWQAVEPPKSKKNRDLPSISAGAEASVGDTQVDAGETRPPSHHNDASILQAMETAGRQLDDRELARAMRGAGLGTPATRASILQTLVHRGFVDRRGKELWATERGGALIDSVPVDELKSAELTGQWEARLSQMADGRESRADFMSDVRAHTARIVAAIAAAEAPAAAAVGSPEPPKALGSCPVCDRPVRDRRSVYACDTGRDCSFVVFKKVAKRDIAKRTVQLLLRGERTPVLHRFKSKAGKSFSAALTLNEDGKVTFVFPPRSPLGQPCPRCEQGKMIEGRRAWGCSRWREGCDYRIAFEVKGKRRTPQECAAELWS